MLILPLGLGWQSGFQKWTAAILLLCVGGFALIFAGETFYDRFDYEPATWNPLTMITSSFLHGGVLHLVGNLVAFACFSAEVERRVHGIGYVILFVFICLVVGIAYSVASMDEPNPLPTIGLSGVVWGFMGLVLVLNPMMMVDCFVWFIVIFKRIEVPVLLFVGGYLAFEFADLKEGANDGVNHIAHVAGFFAGVAARLFLWPWLSVDELEEAQRRAARRRRKEERRW